MKIVALFVLSLSALLLAGKETMTVCLRGNTLYMRSAWNETHDLFRVCGLGGNKQFNYSHTALVSKKVSDHDLMIRGRYPGRFHWCGDSVGVMHMYPEKGGLYILSGNHGYGGSIITMPGHGFTKADIGKKFAGKYIICAVDSKDKFRILPGIRRKKELAQLKKTMPQLKEAKNFNNFPATRTLSRVYKLDGKVIPQKKILKGKLLTVTEKTAICTFEALSKAAFKHDKVNEFYNTWEYVYSFSPNGSCLAECKVTFTRDVCLMGISTMQDSDMELGKNYDFYEKYIPKVKKFAVPANTPWKQAQVRRIDGKWWKADSRTYDFEGVQDMTFKRKGKTTGNPRFEIAVKGGFVDPADLPDRWIEFMGKTENGKKVRKIGNVLGLDSTIGDLRHSKRAQNRLAFIIPAWNKTYPTHFSPGKKIIKKGAVFNFTGYRCYFNPEKIGDATVLFVIHHKDHKKVYADFHKPVRDYVLPFAANAKVKFIEKTPGVTLKGNKLTLKGKYGRIVAEVRCSSPSPGEQYFKKGRSQLK